MINLRVMMASQKNFMKPFGKKLKSPFPIQYENLFSRRAKHFTKLIEEKDRDKRSIKNWRPIYLLNVDMKLISKSLANRLQGVMFNLVSENQSAYVNNRFRSEGGNLISDILEITDSLQTDGLLT